MKNRSTVPFLIFIFTLLVFLPIIINPGIFLNRGNDLTEFFWPIYYFIKNQILINHALPFWNNLFLSGTPLLPDPQAPIFYLPNLIFLFLPLGMAFIVSAFLHTFFGGIFTYLAASRGFRLTKGASTVASLLYIASPRLGGYLEAGHFGLICASMWLPLVVLALLFLAQKPSVKNSVLFAMSLAGLFYTHTTTFVITVALSPFLLLVLHKENKLASFKFFILGATVTFGLIAIAFLPQLSWAPYTNRYLLTSDREVHPIWLSKLEFVKAIFTPWLDGLSPMRNLETEKWITIGIFPSILAFIGFIKIKRTYKMLTLLSVIAIFLIALNNSSPIHSLLFSQNWFVLSRVATRIWFIMVLLVVFLGAYGFQILSRKSAGLAILITSLAVTETVLLSLSKITKSITINKNLAPKEVYEFLAPDHDRFRVFCTTRCLSQKTSAEYGLELVDGYSTLTQKNYNSHAWQMMGSYWNYYTLSIPPIGAYLIQDVYPDAISLGEYNTKYVISSYGLTDKNLALIKNFGEYRVYLNKVLKPRSEAPILVYSPNFIRIDTSNSKEKSITLSEVYSPGWKAYLNGEEKVLVQETPNALRAVDVKQGTQYVDFRYEPDSFVLGRIITLTTLIFLGVFFLRHKKLCELVMKPVHKK